MVIFNSYVKLPEGIWKNKSHVPKHQSDQSDNFITHNLSSKAHPLQIRQFSTE
jgi:hypothetical protein